MQPVRLISYLTVLALAMGVHADGRLDGALRTVASFPQLAPRLLPQASRSDGLARSAVTPSVAALLRFQPGTLDAIRAEGVTVRSVVGDVATVDIPLDSLPRLAAMPEVVYVEAARKMRPRLDASVPATRADTLRSGSGLNLTGATGRGVIVGIVDDGIDFRHMDFRNADGSSRILQLWDMRARAAAGSPPAGFAYGGVCTAAMINAAIQGNSSACTQPSSGGHGTHVGGIAAGNGQATGNGKAAFRMVGMAPQADIVAANPLGDGVQASDSVVDGVNYVKQVASSLGKPAVVNLSLGSYYGARDGTSNYERALSNAVGPGFLITGAVGNEADAPIRATGSISQGQTVNIGYQVPDGSRSYQLEMWYPGKQAYSVRVTGPSVGCDSGLVAAASRPVRVDTSCGAIVVSSSDTQAANDDRQILINLDTGSSPVKTGVWTIALTAVQLDRAVASFSIIGDEDGNGASFTDHVEALTSEIITDTASATNVLSVAAYVTKDHWASLNGKNYQINAGAVGDIASFSSRGPRRNCSNLAKCPPIMKPEITAPGSAIMSSLATDTSAPNIKDTDPDGVHIVESGTSMATPHVTGAIALLLQANPKLGIAEVRQALLRNVQSNGFSSGLPVYNVATLLPQAPNYTWGYGILDAAAAYRSIGGAINITTPSFALHRNAAAGSVVYSATITPATADVGKPVNVYIGVLFGNTVYVRNGENWVAYAPPAIPAATATVAGSSFDVNIATLSDAFNSSLHGSTIYIGYGSSAADMLNGKLGVAGVMQ
ncbi:S8 family serine peptidase [Chitinimonas sp.]|uniref:S8 family serine peptidase n=1 Tax=Chitinimonas sp. TaxID=1934313 RepID=UPI0035AED1FC